MGEEMYYKDDSCWSADLKSKATEDIISIGSFMEVLVLNHYVLVRKILKGLNQGKDDRKTKQIRQKNQARNGKAVEDKAKAKPKTRKVKVKVNSTN
ncbi:hypothetical protein Tco_0318587 [Tanacetum coccineum]